MWCSVTGSLTVVPNRRRWTDLDARRRLRDASTTLGAHAPSRRRLLEAPVELSDPAVQYTAQRALRGAAATIGLSAAVSASMLPPPRTTTVRLRAKGKSQRRSRLSIARDDDDDDDNNKSDAKHTKPRTASHYIFLLSPEEFISLIPQPLISWICIMYIWKAVSLCLLLYSLLLYVLFLFWVCMFVILVLVTIIILFQSLQ